MTASKLSLYNHALRLVAERKLLTVTDNVTSRFHLDTIWDEDPIENMLEQYGWSFARRTQEWNFNAAQETDFGWERAFDVPTDYVRLVQISADEDFYNPLRRYSLEADFWYCDFDTIYIKYVSNDAAFGNDFSLWTKLFEQMVATFMAKELVRPLNKSKQTKKDLEDDYKLLKTQAKSLDAMELPTAFTPQGSWARSRRGGRRQDNIRGSVLVV